MEQHAHQDANEFYYYVCIFDLLNKRVVSMASSLNAKLPGAWLISASSKVHPVSQVAKIL